jgi:hypothetical protein
LLLSIKKLISREVINYYLRLQCAELKLLQSHLLMLIYGLFAFATHRSFANSQFLSRLPRKSYMSNVFSWGSSRSADIFSSPDDVAPEFKMDLLAKRWELPHHSFFKSRSCVFLWHTWKLHTNERNKEAVKSLFLQAHRFNDGNMKN